MYHMSGADGRFVRISRENDRRCDDSIDVSRSSDNNDISAHTVRGCGRFVIHSVVLYASNSTYMIVDV